MGGANRLETTLKMVRPAGVFCRAREVSKNHWRAPCLVGLVAPGPMGAGNAKTKALKK